ncbi:dermonecrotic toxin domain-containing protein [Pseudomonas sp. KCJK8751]|uniref:dermonecrotic toxin domain-containing protein n=1 Tax=Pseudomonas sp. KCJK8751 TaxID=3344564 RepID=UPI003905C652
MNQRQAVVGAAGQDYVKAMLGSVPRADRSASAAIREWARKQRLDLEPDNTLAVTLHCKFVPKRGWLAKVVQQMSMTEALLGNWQQSGYSKVAEQTAQLLLRGGTATVDLLEVLPELSLPHGRAPWAEAFSHGQVTIVDELPGSGLAHDIDVHTEFHGLFRQSAPMRYDASTYVQFDATTFQSYIWQLDFQGVFKRQLDEFWAHAASQYSVSACIAFLAACNRQALRGNLSEQGRSLAWRAAGVERWHHGASLSANGVDARLLNINGYPSSDILCLSDMCSRLTLLYLPGNAAPLHEFANPGAMRAWLARQCRDADKRAALLAHFRACDIPDRIGRSGLRRVLQGMGDFPPRRIILPATSVYRLIRVWNPHTLINYKADTYSPRIEYNLFEALTVAQRQRSQSDADFLITRDSEVTKAAWRRYFYLTMNLATPFLLVVPGLLPLAAVAGVAQFTVGLDQALHGKDVNQQLEGAEQAVFGLLNAAPGLARGVKASKALFGQRPIGFIKPVRLNGRTGYPLSPVSPPRWPGHPISRTWQ